MSNTSKPTNSIDPSINTNDNTAQPAYISTSIHDFYHPRSHSELSQLNNTFSHITVDNNTSHHIINNNIINNNITSSYNKNDNNWDRNFKDNVAYGDSIEYKEDDVIRIYYQNLHGIKNLIPGMIYNTVFQYCTTGE